jgi:hypothetical protein
MVDFTSTQAQAEELDPPVHCGEARTEVVAARSPSAPTPLTALIGWTGCTVNYRDLHHHRRVASGVHSLASGRLNSTLSSSRNESTKARCGAIRDKIGTIASY